MYPMDSGAVLAQMVIEQRIREAQQQQLARQVRAGARPTADATADPTADPKAAPQPRRHSRLWVLLHFRHSFG
ncbi:hypothetical protein [Nocardioides sp. YIM 152315]|uniref:hypothetical protein n=1 Tax=Nocardioides sp. YIM 152315 TaxID=3031760 RepID=UPI0023DB65C2|nr:hypothetical protein [Nocardioides sp. YIM 152315]MDF1602603.1 hypothetical protein [Nocardioides sp. YIM 152315]